MKSPLRSLLLVLKTIAASCVIASAQVQYFETPPPEIVSAWKLNAENLVVVFGYDGTYYLIENDSTPPGMERGTFEWDNETGEFSVNTVVDTNGDAGLSHPGAPTTVTVSGNTLNYTVPGEGTFTFSRVVNTASAIVGSWVVPGAKISLTFLADGNYYIATEENDFNESPGYYSGMEKGTYAWNSSTKVITATATRDANGQSGLSNISPSSTVSITGNVMTFFDGDATTTLTRITTKATPLRLPDFEVARFANYKQTSSGNPVLRTFDVANETYPYSSDVIIDSEVNAIAPTFQIGAGTPFIIGDEGDGSFDSEGGFASLSGANSLNTFLPASTALQFKSGTATANLLTPAALTFPTTPKIIVRVGDAWIGGIYRFGEAEVLQWTLPTGFTASQYITILEVYDPNADFDAVVATLQGEVTHFDLAGKLEPGKEYSVELEFYRIDSSTTTGTGVFAGKQGRLLSASSTLLQIESLPDTAQEPFITEQPVSQAGTPGSPLFLTVGINEEAFPTSTFQWFKNNQEIEGQTGNSLFFPSFSQAADKGNYTVSITNDNGSTTSDVAQLGAGVESLVIDNQKMFRQTTAALGSPSGGKFDARVEGFGITNTFPASAITVTKPNNTILPLAVDGDHWDVETDFPSFADMRAAFPTGVYKITIGSDVVPITLTGNAFPNQPLVTSSVGTWVNGKLQITASQAAETFTLTTNSNNSSGFSRISITDPSDDGILDAFPSFPNNFVVAEIPAGLLSVGNSYEVETLFGRQTALVDLSSKSWASTEGASGVERLDMATFLTIEVVPDPVGNPYTLWQARFFNSTQLANPAISGDEVDFDNDGIANILEFILGGNPTTPNPNLLRNTTSTSTPATVGRNLVFSYDRKTEANGIGQVIETSSTLTGTWTPAVNGVNGVVIATSTIDGTTQRVTATIPSTQDILFVRLKATR